jgi:hypothetical protein
MKTIEVSDEMYDFLMELSKELNTQKDRCTANPRFYQIMTKEKIAVPEGCGKDCYYYDGSEIETEKEIVDAIYDWLDGEMTKKKIRELSASDKEYWLKEAGWRKANYDYKDEYQNAFLTEKACKEHIRLNHYHYKEPVDYLTAAFRNPELEQLLKFLSGLTDAVK